ncbi:NfeD family protein [bacterium]|nr:NfeD family protein [bacterium]
MAEINQFLDSLTLWHWIGVAVVLLTFEVVIGTFDLLWISIGAFCTAAFAALAPEAWAGGQGQLAFFALMAIVFVVLGRTVFSGIRRPATSHPNLNNRLSSMVGKQARAVVRFQGGRGRVSVGDTMWLAEAEEGANIDEGADVMIVGGDGTMLRVRPG